MSYTEQLEASIQQLFQLASIGEDGKSLDSNDVFHLSQVIKNQQVELAIQDKRIDELEEYVSWLKDELAEFKSRYSEVKQ